MVASFGINTAGFVIAGMFVAVWAAALACWRFGDAGARRTAGLEK